MPPAGFFSGLPWAALSRPADRLRGCNEGRKRQTARLRAAVPSCAGGMGLCCDFLSEGPGAARPLCARGHPPQIALVSLAITVLGRTLRPMSKLGENGL